MKQNPYDNKAFFEKYSQMDRSTKGLAGAGEWKTLESMLPEFKAKRVLDLGCGFGWHCQYAIEHGAKAVTGIDISEKMLAIAKEKTSDKICYHNMPIEEISFSENTFDAVISSLAFHY
ncbi:MAG TPA: SAM-dependent methyltransferase, partial [Lachnoclostridium sp.]|nr:SAM-dependent methyltransferase [Lachnoclostridium sp.]